jgi:H+/gluconate symporter-like permease
VPSAIGVGRVLAAGLPVIALAYEIGRGMRTAQGSATVATAMTTGIVAPRRTVVEGQGRTGAPNTSANHICTRRDQGVVQHERGERDG